MVHEWELITYDVWGIEEDGWEVNNSFHTGKKIEFNESITNKELEELVFDKLGFIGTVDNSQSFDNYIYFSDESNGCPSFELRRVVLK